jgi:hypothetical protein
VFSDQRLGCALNLSFAPLKKRWVWAGKTTDFDHGASRQFTSPMLRMEEDRGYPAALTSMSALARRP